ncbi:MAG: hypothetical protein ACOC7R_04185 [Planctomycetota bacterium]
MKRLFRLIVVVALCAGFYTLGQRPGSPRIADWLDRPAGETAQAGRDTDRPEWLNTAIDRTRTGLRSALETLGGEERTEEESPQAAKEDPPPAQAARYERDPIPQCW